jgi:MinD-like ATPase involved in chromosome partitioning or flagellar assembly
MTQDVPAIPLVTAVVRSDATGELTVDGEAEAIGADDSAGVSEQILSRVAALADSLGRPVRLTTDDDQGRWPLIVHPDGHVESGGEPLLKPVPEPQYGEPADLQPQSASGSLYFGGTPLEVENLDIDDDDDDDDDDDGEAAEREFLDGLAASDPDSHYAPMSASDPGAAWFEHPEHPADAAPDAAAVATPAAAAVDAEVADEAPYAAPTVNEVPAHSDAHESARRTEPLLPTRRDVRASFLNEETRPKPATQGVRGFFAKMGMRIPPSATELAERSDVHAVSQHWPGPRTIAVVNGKGGANKTPTTAMLSAVFARNGGSGVLAWDNNETRGTLGWRTEQGPHASTVQSLLPNAEALLSPAAQAADLSQFVHHQTGDKYDVLRSNPTMLATEQRIAAADFDRLHAVVAKYFRLIFVDSGNDESAERWLRMIDHTDQLVIATTALGEHAEAGALLLEALAQRDEHSAKLAAGAVVIVSQSEKSSSLAAAREVARGFESLARVAVSVPFDRAMHGGKLRYDDLAPATRRAWLRAAAAVAEGL